jgi:hypothetical protein
MLFLTYQDLQSLVVLFSFSATTLGVYGDFSHMHFDDLIIIFIKFLQLY